MVVQGRGEGHGGSLRRPGGSRKGEAGLSEPGYGDRSPVEPTDLELAQEELSPGVRRTRPLVDGRRPTWDEAVALLRDEPAFRRALADDLRGAPYEALRWETPPVSAATRDRPFEYVALDTPALAGVAEDPAPFAEHLEGCAGEPEVARFPNLGGDAELVVPCAADPAVDHAHLAGFLRGAPEEQVDRLWRVLGEAVAERLARDPAPVWVSTAGLGVFWVHLRLDARPKYYAHAPYRRA